MKGRIIYGFVIGTVVGGWPFWQLGFAPTAPSPGWIGLAVAAVLSATAFRTPFAWLLGVPAGVLASWASLVVLIGSGWRLLPYIVLGSWAYYVAVGYAVLGALLLASMRRAPATTGPAVSAQREPYSQVPDLWFYVLTFALTWTAWFAASALAQPPNAGIAGPVFLLGVSAPGIVAVALIGRREGHKGVERLLSGIARWRVSTRWYLFAVVYLAAITLMAAVVIRVFSGVWPAFGGAPIALMLGAILVSTWVQAGEEVGWRGYALPHLAARVGLGPAAVLLGIVWAVWHLPLFILPATGSTGQSFPVYLLHVTALSVAMAWLYWRTGGSLLLVMVMHASVNNTSGIVPAAVPGANEPFAFAGSPVAWAIVALSWIVAVPLLWQMRRATLSVATTPVRSPQAGVAD